MAIPSVYKLAAEALKTMRAYSPYDTGNLRELGIWLHKTGTKEYTIFIGAPTAPYAVYTNEAWVSPRWNGRKNPNQHWIDIEVQNIVNEICAATGGKLNYSSGEIDRWINKSYWESNEGKKMLERYKIIDYKQVVS